MSRYTDIELQNKKLPPIGGYWNENLVPLEAALKPVESLFNELSRSIKTAKKHCTFPSEHGLTRDESAAVYLYTMEGGQNSFYKVLNNALRSENRPALKVWFPYLKLFDVAIAKLPTIKASIWRGVPGNVSGQFKRGQVFTWWSISSCSQTVDVIQDFLGTTNNSTLFMIEATNAKDISSYSYYPSENEIVLSMGTELRVKSDSLKHTGGLNIVHLVQINHDSDSESGDDDENNVSEKLPETVGKMTLKTQKPETHSIDTVKPATAFSANMVTVKPDNDVDDDDDEKEAKPSGKFETQGSHKPVASSTTTSSDKVDVGQLLQALVAHLNINPNRPNQQSRSSTITRYPKSVENFCYILENRISISSAEQQTLRGLINFGFTIDDINSTEGTELLRKIVNEKIILIITKDSMENLSKAVRDEPLLYGIYVVESSQKKSFDSKFYRGSFTNVNRVCQQLNNDLLIFTFDLTSVCSIQADYVGISTLNYVQMLKDILLENDDKRGSKKEMIEFCREEYADNTIQLKLINEFERDFEETDAIDWYSRPETFVYKMLTRAIRVLDPDILYKLRYFIQHLHEQLKSSSAHPKSGTLYRTMRIRRELFDKMKKYQNPLVSFNEFLFLKKGLAKSEPCLVNVDTQLVRFQFNLESNCFRSNIPSRPNDVLLTLGTVFRLNKIEQFNQDIYTIYLVANDETLKASQLIISSLRDTVRASSPLLRMLKLMKHREAMGYVEYFSQIAIDDPYVTKDETSSVILGGILHSLGNHLYEKKQYDQAISYFKNSLKVYSRFLSEDDARLTPTYNNIGSAHNRQGLHEQALEYHRKAYEIQKKSKNPDMDSISTYLGNIASVLVKLGRHAEAARHFELALQIQQRLHPKNDNVELAMVYYNLAGAQYRSKQYPEAAENYQRCLEIELKCHPSNHPTVAVTYHNLATSLEELGRLKEAKEAVENAIQRLLLTKKEDDEEVKTNRKSLQRLEQKLWMKNLLDNST